jgi:hypothetical protein
MTLTDFFDTLKTVFNIVSSVGKLQITGGEPLLHKDLAEMLYSCFKYSGQFDKLWLFTNCAVPIKENVIEVLSECRDKVFVHCSDYGIKPGISDDVVRALSENSIEYRYNKYFGDSQYFNGWVDQGDFEKHYRTTDEIENVFANCSHVKRGGSWYVRGGQMHWCGRSIRGVEIGKIPSCRTDYIDLFVGTVDERRARLRELMQAKRITACDYCNGLYGTEDVSARHPAGEQII